MADLHIVPAQPGDLLHYLDFLEEIEDWLESKGIEEWDSGMFRDARHYFAESIERGEVHLAFIGGQMVGTLRLISRDAIVWPEIIEDDGAYVYNLAVGRTWSGQRLGRRMLEWAERRTAAMGRDYLRLDCFANNDFLPGYYRDAGFTDRGEVDAQYPAPIGTLRLRRFEKRVSIGRSSRR